MNAFPRHLMLAPASVYLMGAAVVASPMPQSDDQARPSAVVLNEADSDQTRFDRAMDAEVQHRYRRAQLVRLRHLAVERRQVNRVREIDQLLAEIQTVHAERMQEHLSQMNAAWQSRLRERIADRKEHRDQRIAQHEQRMEAHAEHRADRREKHREGMGSRSDLRQSQPGIDRRIDDDEPSSGGWRSRDRRRPHESDDHARSGHVHDHWSSDRRPDAPKRDQNSSDEMTPDVQSRITTDGADSKARDEWRMPSKREMDARVADAIGEHNADDLFRKLRGHIQRDHELHRANKTRAGANDRSNADRSHGVGQDMRHPSPSPRSDAGNADAPRSGRTRGAHGSHRDAPSRRSRGSREAPERDAESKGDQGRRDEAPRRPRR